MYVLSSRKGFGHFYFFRTGLGRFLTYLETSCVDSEHGYEISAENRILLYFDFEF